MELVAAAEVAAAADAAAVADAAAGAYATPSDAAAAAAAAVAEAAAAAAAAAATAEAGTDAASAASDPPADQATPLQSGHGGDHRRGATEDAQQEGAAEILPMPTAPPPAASTNTALHVHISELRLTFADRLAPACDPLHLGAGPRPATVAAGAVALVVSGTQVALTRHPSEPSAALFSTQQRSSLALGRVACELVRSPAIVGSDDNTSPSALPLRRMPLLLPGRVHMSSERHWWHGVRSVPSCAFLECTAPTIALSISPDHLRTMSDLLGAVRRSSPRSPAAAATTIPTATPSVPAAAEGEPATAGQDADLAPPTRTRSASPAPVGRAADAMSKPPVSRNDLREGGEFVPSKTPGGRAAAWRIAYSDDGHHSPLERWIAWRYPIPRTLVVAHVRSALSTLSNSLAAAAAMAAAAAAGA